MRAILLALVVGSVAILFLPLAGAHQDGCLVAAHQGGVQGHYLCSSAPNTCFMNQQATGGVQVHVVCEEPESQPCVAKVVALVASLKCGGDGPVPTTVDA